MEDKFFWHDWAQWVVLGGAGVLGRLMYHARMVQEGKRKPFTWVLLWDIPISLGMGWIALGVGTYLDVKWEVVVSIALVFAYLGPYSVDRLFGLYANKLIEKKGISK